MNAVQVDVTKMSLLELKAIGFDTQNIIASQQQSLDMINAEIAKRSQEEHKSLSDTIATKSLSTKENNK